ENPGFAVCYARSPNLPTRDRGRSRVRIDDRRAYGFTSPVSRPFSIGQTWQHKTQSNRQTAGGNPAACVGAFGPTHADTSSRTYDRVERFTARRRSSLTNPRRASLS